MCALRVEGAGTKRRALICLWTTSIELARTKVRFGILSRKLKMLMIFFWRLPSPPATQTWTRASPTLLEVFFPHQTCDFDTDSDIPLKKSPDLRSHEVSGKWYTRWYTSLLMVNSGPRLHENFVTSLENSTWMHPYRAPGLPSHVRTSLWSFGDDVDTQFLLDTIH